VQASGNELTRELKVRSPIALTALKTLKNSDPTPQKIAAVRVLPLPKK